MQKLFVNLPSVYVHIYIHAWVLSRSLTPPQNAPPSTRLEPLAVASISHSRHRLS